jgi:hypothetical protein
MTPTYCIHEELKIKGVIGGERRSGIVQGAEKWVKIEYFKLNKCDVFVPRHF